MGHSSSDNKLMSLIYNKQTETDRTIHLGNGFGSRTTAVTQVKGTKTFTWSYKLIAPGNTLIVKDSNSSKADKIIYKGNKTDPGEGGSWSDTNKPEDWKAFKELATLVKFNYVHPTDVSGGDTWSEDKNGGTPPTITLGTLKYRGDKVYYNETSNKNIETTLQVPYKYTANSNWKEMTGDSHNLLNTTITKTNGITLFP
jgi:hypothetical protein